MTILVIGYSRCVMSLLLTAAEKGKRFNVIVNETRPTEDGYVTANELKKNNIPVKLIIDSAVGYFMSKIDFVLTGAESVVENGGIINKIGTYNIAIIAKAHKKPFYVAAESYKFLREYPLNQSDIEEIYDRKTETISIKKEKENDNLDDEIEIISSLSDFTPPSYITLLFTDLGILTPSAVSDELIKLYYNV